MNPLIEQHDNNFLMYTKNKFKLLVQQDTTVSLLIDEIHLKSYKLIKHHFFLHSVNQRKLAMHITLNVLADYQLLFNVDTCDEGHNIEKIQRMFVRSSTNTLLNDFVPKEIILKITS